jgi:hypothetical protein
MKKGTSTLFLLMAVLLSTAQKNSEQGQLTTLTKLDLGLMGVGFTVEPRLGNHMTMDLSVGAGGGYEVYSSNFHHTWNLFDPSFYFSVTPKLYYNRARRMAKGKSVKNNAGNYFGLRLKYTTPSIGGDTDAFNTALMNIHWGMQRPAGTRWIFNTHFGVGYATDLEGFGGTLYPALDLKFSYIFSKQR